MATSIPDEWLAGDFEAFEECMADASAEMDGYWSPFAVLAWIASSGDVKFLGGVQAFEKRNHAHMGKPHSWPTWLVVGNWAGQAFGITFSDASEKLRVAMAANRIAGAIATDERSGELVHLDRAIWTRWNIAHHNWGLSFIPGLVDFKWPAEAIQDAFPASQTVVRVSAKATSGKYNNRRPTPQQQEAFRFLESAGAYLPGGSQATDRAHLWRIYKTQFTDKAALRPRLTGAAFGLTQFKEQVRRFVDEGDRIVRGRWVVQTPDSPPE